MPDGISGFSEDLLSNSPAGGAGSIFAGCVLIARPVGSVGSSSAWSGMIIERESRWITIKLMILAIIRLRLPR
jgi:hypothetical protein